LTIGPGIKSFDIVNIIFGKQIDPGKHHTYEYLIRNMLFKY